GEVAEEEVMVDDEDVGHRRVTPCALVEARLEMRALGAQTDVGLAGNLVPHLGRRLEREILQRALAGALEPLQDCAQLRLLCGIEEGARTLGGEARAPDRDIVVPPLDEGEAKRDAERSAQERQVLPDEL